MEQTASGAAAEPAGAGRADGLLPNLWAGGLLSYGFGVRTGLGSKPMRYLVGRRFTGNQADVADTVLFVIEPSVLFGTYVHIAEDARRRTCTVHTFLPTMARPLRVADKLMFDCLPLTDVGYVDLMAWRPPALQRAEHGSSWDDPSLPGTWSYRFDGDPELPPLWVHEEIDAELAVVVRRTFWRAGTEVRRWEVTEVGEPGRSALPRQIRVCRPRTGHQTEFARFTPPAAVPPDLFDARPEHLRDWLVDALDDADAR
jgi:hypothetical protein